MLYWKYSSNRIFLLNEYWIFIPSALLANYLIIRKIRLNRARMEELRKELRRLIRQIEREKKLRKILLLSLGLSVSGYGHLLTRGGSTDLVEIIDTDYIKFICNIDEGIHYVDDIRLRNIVTDLYRHKNKGKIIYVTATALCHIANRYGQTFLALPFAIGDFGVTSLYQTARKGFVTILLGAVGPLYMAGNPVSLILAFIVGVSGLSLSFTNLDFIATSPVDFTRGLKPRIPGVFDVVVVNEPNKIMRPDLVTENQECWLPDQRLLNPNCKIKHTEIPDAIDSSFADLKLKYEDIVNMKDVTGLDRSEFTDKFDLGETEPSLDKFGDSRQISD